MAALTPGSRPGQGPAEGGAVQCFLHCSEVRWRAALCCSVRCSGSTPRRQRSIGAVMARSGCTDQRGSIWIDTRGVRPRGGVASVDWRARAGRTCLLRRRRMRAFAGAGLSPSTVLDSVGRLVQHLPGVQLAPARTWLVLAAGQRVGSVALRPSKDEEWLNHFNVLPEHQGRGLGDAALRAPAVSRPRQTSVWPGTMSALRLSQHHVPVTEAPAAEPSARPAPPHRSRPREAASPRRRHHRCRQAPLHQARTKPANWVAGWPKLARLGRPGSRPPIGNAAGQAGYADDPVPLHPSALISHLRASYGR